MMFEDMADANLEVLTDPKGKIKKDEWFHFASTWEYNEGKSSKEAYLYINGVEWAKQTNVGLLP